MLSFFIGTFFSLILYYFLATGAAFTLLTINDRLKVVQKRTPLYKDYIREVNYSLLGLLMFTIMSTILYQTDLLKYTTLYYNIEVHGWLYYFAVIPIMFVIYDLYFYVIHRIIHHEKLFTLVHLIHHKSKYVSPLSALSTHPIEAIVNHGGLVILFLILPIHTSHVYIWVAVTILQTTYLHLGVELYSDKFLQTRVGKLVYTATDHAKHHSFFEGNYGFYTLIWDKLFKTLSKK